MALLSPSGGIVYHLRAARYRAGLWLPFRQRLEAWLEQHLRSAPQVLLVGPSAGHCLPLERLARYPKLIALEPDRLAGMLLRARLPGVTIAPRDLLVRPLLDGAPALDTLLKDYPDATVLFCNMLGQLQFDLSELEQGRFQSEFRRRILPALMDRPWLSFHDRWSFDLTLDPSLPLELDFAHQPADDELARTWFGTEGPVLSAFDHGTTQLFPADLPRRYLGWQLTPGTYHLIEAVSGP